MVDIGGEMRNFGQQSRAGALGLSAQYRASGLIQKVLAVSGQVLLPLATTVIFVRSAVFG